MRSERFDSDSFDLTVAVRQAQRASVYLAATSGAVRNRALLLMADALRQRQNEILECNTLDLEVSREMAIPDLVLDWLKLTPERLAAAVECLHRLVEAPDPLGRTEAGRAHPEGYLLSQRRIPLGVIGLVYEAFPDLVIVAAGLCLKSGNSLVLKGGSEASNSSTAIVQAIQEVLDRAELPEGCLEQLPSDQGELMRELATQDRYLDLVIPYGRPSLVQQVARQATVPVLTPALGNCYLYVSVSAAIPLAAQVILDSHRSEPDPVNAIEKVLLHPQLAVDGFEELWRRLEEQGLEVRGCPLLSERYPGIKLVEAGEWEKPYLSNVVACKQVADLSEAIVWINRNSSGHADGIVTDSYRESQRFAAEVNSASVWVNASPRFLRNTGPGGTVRLGMASRKGRTSSNLRRPTQAGPIGLEELTTVKQLIQGSGNLD